MPWGKLTPRPLYTDSLSLVVGAWLSRYFDLQLAQSSKVEDLKGETFDSVYFVEEQALGLWEDKLPFRV